jgi:hypothetical protein
MNAAVIDGDLIVPYCYGGNDRLVGVYFGWKRIGEHWFARFTWLDREIAGFAFLKQESLDVLTGAWWYDDEKMRGLFTSASILAPPDPGGLPSRWKFDSFAACHPFAKTEAEVETQVRQGVISRLTTNRLRTLHATPDEVLTGDVRDASSARKPPNGPTRREAFW